MPAAEGAALLGNIPEGDCNQETSSEEVGSPGPKDLVQERAAYQSRIEQEARSVSLPPPSRNKKKRQEESLESLTVVN